MQIAVNETGARTINEARPMLINGKSVYVVVETATAYLMIGTETVAERASNGDMSTREAQEWAVEYRTSLTVAVTADIAAPVRETGKTLDAEADKMAAAAPTGIYKFRNVTGRMSRVEDNDPRHPMNKARQLKRDAAVLMAWTATDEQGYGQYISDGLADTDGFFAPLSRQAWKSPLSF